MTSAKVYNFHELTDRYGKKSMRWREAPIARETFENYEWLETAKIAKKCHEILCEFYSLQCFKNSAGQIEIHFGSINGQNINAIARNLQFIDTKGDSIIVKNHINEIIIEQAGLLLSIKYFGIDNGRKTYIISGHDKSGITFKKRWR